MIQIGVIQSTLDRKKIKDVFLPDDVVLNTIGNSISFLSDFIPADVHLFKLEDNNIIKTIFEAKPSVYTSFYKRSHINHSFKILKDSLFNKVLNELKMVEGSQGEIFNGMTIFQNLYPVINSNNKFIGFLMIERSIQEQKIWGLKQWLHQLTVNNLIKSVLQTSLFETRSLPTIYPSDGILILDSQGVINYSNYIANNIAHFLGLLSPLEGNSFQDIFNQGTWKIIDMNYFYSEQELNINNKVLNIKSITFDTIQLVLIRDISELRHKDQEIKVKSAIIKEIHHRVKNNLQSIASLLRLQQRRSQNIEVKDILGDSINRVNSISMVHDYLSQKNVDVVDLTELTKKLTLEIVSSFSSPDKKITFDIDSPESLLFSSAKAVSVALVLNELLNNTVKHAFSDSESGNLSIVLKRDESFLYINIIDNGVGLPKDFSPERNGNLGWQIINTLVNDDLKGIWQIKELCKGTEVELKIPI